MEQIAGAIHEMKAHGEDPHRPEFSLEELIHDRKRSLAIHDLFLLQKLPAEQ
jgi:hypothetical protein